MPYKSVTFPDPIPNSHNSFPGSREPGKVNRAVWIQFLAIRATGCMAWGDMVYEEMHLAVLDEFQEGIFVVDNRPETLQHYWGNRAMLSQVRL